MRFGRSKIALGLGALVLVGALVILRGRYSRPAEPQSDVQGKGLANPAKHESGKGTTHQPSPTAVQPQDPETALTSFRKARDQFLAEVQAAMDVSPARAYELAVAAIKQPHNLQEKARALYAIRALPFLADRAQLVESAFSLLRGLAEDEAADMECRKMALASMAGHGGGRQFGEPIAVRNTDTNQVELVWAFSDLHSEVPPMGSLLGEDEILCGNLRSAMAQDKELQVWLVRIVKEPERDLVAAQDNLAGLRHAALVALLSVGAREYSTEIANLLGTEREGSFRLALAYGLARLAKAGDTSAASALVSRSSVDPNPTIRALGVDSLQKVYPRYSGEVPTRIMESIAISPPFADSDRMYRNGADRLVESAFLQVAEYYSEQRGSPAVQALAHAFLQKVLTWGDAAPLESLVEALTRFMGPHLPLGELRRTIEACPDSERKSKALKKLDGVQREWERQYQK